MASRPIWNGSIAFGLVYIPIGLYSAEERDEISFTMLDKHGFSPVGYQRINKETGKKVEWSDVVKGYEYEKGSYVVLSDEELAHANVEATQTIDIAAFVDRAEIDPMFVERPLYAVPNKQGRKAYDLLLETLTRTGRAGIAQVVLRTRQHLAALVPHGDVLVVLLLRYAHELRSAKDLDLPTPASKAKSVSAAERKMAEKLVEGMAAKWKPGDYQDTYHDDVMALVRKKVESGKPTAITHPKAPKPTTGAKVVDLVELLSKSLAKPGAHGHGRASPQSHAVKRAHAPHRSVHAAHKKSA